MTQIERREARLRRIHTQHYKDRKPTVKEVATTPHVMGKSQNYPKNIPLFLRKHSEDPAVKVIPLIHRLDNIHLIGQDFVPKLKEHILPRIQDMLRREAALNPDAYAGQSSTRDYGTKFPARDSIFFKNDRMYHHPLAKLNYTTYDVRRAQDVIHYGTSHCDVMLLANTGDSDHPFLYARVIGIYHVNVIYTGEGMLDYNARRVDFLWVRWFSYDDGRSIRWEDLKLDSVHFPPMAMEGAFGFADPRDVLRGCHIVPAFARGKVHSDEVGLSRCVGDAHDWRHYYVNRCATIQLLLAFY